MASGAGVLAVLVARSPETADLPDPAPQYRPQRVAVPAHARGLTGAGAGLAFSGALATAGATAPPESRAEALAFERETLTL